jgi:hypothetical protein
MKLYLALNLVVEVPRGDGFHKDRVLDLQDGTADEAISSRNRGEINTRVLELQARP